MADIQIIIPPVSPKGEAMLPIVNAYETAVRRGEYVTWRVCSLNESVFSIKIQFKDQTATYFPGMMYESALETLQAQNYDSAKGTKTREAFIHARAPRYASNKRSVDAYSIVCNDELGQEIVNLTLDPIIIVDEPNP